MTEAERKAMLRAGLFYGALALLLASYAVVILATIDGAKHLGAQLAGAGCMAACAVLCVMLNRIYWG